MTAAGVPGMWITSDLRLSIDGVHATVVADGRRLVVTTEDAGRFVARAADSMPADASAPASLRRSVARAALLLDRSGLTATLTSRRGALVELGHGCDSTLGRVLLGTPRAQLGTPATVLAAASGYLRTSARARRPLGYGAGGLLVAGLLIVTTLRRRGGLSP